MECSRRFVDIFLVQLRKYFDSTIQTAWTQYLTTPLTLTSNGRQFISTTVGSTSTFTEGNPSAAYVDEVFTVMKPSTQDIPICAGTMAMGVSGTGLRSGMKMQLSCSLENQVCAATNRGILLTPSANWTNAATYHQSLPANFYSQCWHITRSGPWRMGSRMTYDDNNNQSPVATGQAEHNGMWHRLVAPWQYPWDCSRLSSGNWTSVGVMN